MTAASAMLAAVDERPSSLERGVLGGLGVFRGVAWAWMVVVLVVTRDDLARPGTAVAMAAATLSITLALGAISRWAPHLLLNRVVIALEVVAGAALLTADGWVYDGAHSQSLGSAWPLAGVLSAGVVAGPVAGVGAGLVLGLGRFGGTLVDDLPSPGNLSLVSTGVLFALAGGAAGVVMARLRRAERLIAATRAREEVARTLHDGVLQTLAVVQRRSSDRELADLARTQERELRQFLFGIDREPGDLLTELRREAHTAERRHEMTVTVTAVDEPGAVRAEVVDAVTGAVREALTNAAKHGGASRAVVFVDPDERGGLFVSITDDGCGFDPDSAVEGVGLGRSIRARIADVGGEAEVASEAGAGTEVRLHLASVRR